MSKRKAEQPATAPDEATEHNPDPRVRALEVRKDAFEVTLPLPSSEPSEVSDG